MQTLFALTICAAIAFGSPDPDNAAPINPPVINSSNNVNIEPEKPAKENKSLVQLEPISLSIKEPKSNLFGCKFIADLVNNAVPKLWKASHFMRHSSSLDVTGRNSLTEAKGNVSLLEEYDQKDTIQSRALKPVLPGYFDARRKYPYCPSLKKIENLGCGCKSSWAVAPVSALSDRFCIASKGDVKPKLSARNVMTCCDYCTQGQGCEGGFSLWAWVYLQQTGTVTGGSYSTHKGCQNYPLPPCTGQISQFGLISQFATSTLNCKQKCDDGQTDPEYYYSYKSYSRKNSSIKAIQRDIFENGPVTADMRVYEDFLCYSGGIYSHMYGDQISVLTVKLIGWGKENGVDYWLAANSWGTEWGEGGFFRIRLGTNECDIERVIIAGLPDLIISDDHQ